METCLVLFIVDLVRFLMI